MNVRQVENGILEAILTNSAEGPKVVRSTPFATPWRVVLITPDAPSLYAANALILNLNEPNKLGDVSWVKPMKYVGIWWGMHLDTHTWHAGPKHGATTANTRRMIDFAAAHGFKGVLVEGWNKGWEDWFATGDDFSFTETYPGLRPAGPRGLRAAQGRRADRPPRDVGQHRPLRKADGGRLRPLPKASACPRSRPATCPTPAACRRLAPTGARSSNGTKAR